MKVPFPFVSFLIASTLLILIYAVPIIAVECGTTPTDACTISQTTTFNPGTYNLPNGISIVANNIILNCNGATLNGSKTSGGSGIKLADTGLNSIVIANCKITNYYFHGIHSETNLTNSVILNNQITNNTRGGIRIMDEGETPSTSSNNIIRGNTIVQNGMANLYAGIDMAYAASNIIKNNIIESTGIGVRIIDGNNNNLTSNTLRYHDKAIVIEGNGNPGSAVANAIQQNIIESSTVGIFLNYEASNSLIESNTLLLNSQAGIHLRQSSDNEVRNNGILNTAGKGLMLGIPGVNSSAMRNLIHRNNFISNTQSAYDYGSMNNWNSTDVGSFYLEFSTPSQGCDDVNLDNICDTPYDVNSGNGNIGGENQGPLDYLPRVGMFSQAEPPSFDFLDDVTVNEGDDAIIQITASGGVPPLTYFITHPEFINNSNILTWQTNFTDANTYNSGIATVVVQDSTNIKAAQNITLTVNDVANTECSSAVKNSCTVSASTTLPANSHYNFKNGIRITGDNLILDCAGSIFDGSGFHYVDDGIKLEGRTGVTVQNCNVQNYDEGFKLTSALNSILSAVEARANRIGINLESSNNNQLLNVLSTENWRSGVELTSSSQNTLDGGSAINGKYMNPNTFRGGVVLTNSNTNTIQNMMIMNNTDPTIQEGIGLFFFGSSGNTVQNNRIGESAQGIFLRDASSSNTITNNTIQQNGAYGIRPVLNSINNLIYRNNLINNPIQAADTGSSNIWNLNNEGNYWSDYDTTQEGCNDSNLNGLCDAPKTFFYNQDNFPFTNIDGWINSWPIFTSTPVTAAQDGSLYTYDADAVDPNNDPITYALITAPSGMTIDSSTGVITWTAHGTWTVSPPVSFPTPYGRGKAQQLIAAPVPVIVEARDSSNGARTQSWQIEISPGTSNACPVGVPC